MHMDRVIRGAFKNSIKGSVSKKAIITPTMKPHTHKSSSLKGILESPRSMPERVSLSHFTNPALKRKNISPNTTAAAP